MDQVDYFASLPMASLLGTFCTAAFAKDLLRQMPAKCTVANAWLRAIVQKIVAKGDETYVNKWFQRAARNSLALKPAEAKRRMLQARASKR